MDENSSIYRLVEPASRLYSSAGKPAELVPASRLAQPSAAQPLAVANKPGERVAFPILAREYRVQAWHLAPVSVAPGPKTLLVRAPLKRQVDKREALRQVRVWVEQS